LVGKTSNSEGTIMMDEDEWEDGEEKRGEEGRRKGGS
jgi:hypothetical protein